MNDSPTGARIRTRILFGVAIAAGALLIGLVVSGLLLSQRIEPFVRAQTISYLEERFDAEVSLESLRVGLSLKSPYELLLRGGRGASAQVSGRLLSLRPRDRRKLPPLLAMRRFSFELDLHSFWNGPVMVSKVRLDGLEINIPPRRDRPQVVEDESQGELPLAGSEAMPTVLFNDIVAADARLTVIPRNPAKHPVVFEIRRLRLESAGRGIAIRYAAVINDAKPFGTIDCDGTFGPWITGNPSDTHIAGKYRAEDGNLAAFKGISGRLTSTGEFSGRLGEVVIDGQTRTPDFALAMSGNRLPLETRFHALLNAGNGNTLLQPVQATLGSTRFEVRGGIEHESNSRGKTLDLDVVLNKGRLEDLLMLAMKGGKPVMRGEAVLKMKLTLPPGKQDIDERLRMTGDFRLAEAHFTGPSVQKGIDSISRRAQGKPGDTMVEEVPCQMEGRFQMAGGVIDFSELRFSIPGALVELIGHYLFGSEQLDFEGKARTQARVSQMVTGWKRWALKPIDRFFAKDGYGAVVRIRINGTRERPEFAVAR